MSFQIFTQPFFGADAAVALPDGRDPLLEYVLVNTQTGELASVIPGFGAILRRLVLQHRPGSPAADSSEPTLFSLIETPESPQALLADETYASAVLYPFASRIKHGIYSFEGVDYALPMNETRRNNALHGLVYNQPFIVVAQNTDEHMARLTLRYVYGGEITGYPFPFELTITYTLSSEGLTLDYAAQNTGPSPSPSSFGWHPYLTLRPYPHVEKPGVVESDTLIDNMTLVLPAQSVVVLGDDLMPTGAVNPLATDTFTLKDWQVDSLFTVSASETRVAESLLRAPLAGVTLVVGQETGPGKLNYLIVFTPPKRDSIAIEPQTAAVNAFNTGDGLSVLKPGDALEGRIWIRLRP